MKRRGTRCPSATQQLAQLLSQAEHQVTRQLERVLEPAGTTVEQWRAMALLADGQSHSMSEIAQVALLSPPSLTRLIDRMVADNLAYRTADPQDRRRVLVHVTVRGRRLHEQLARRIERQQDEILAHADTQHVAQLAALLGDLVHRMR